MLLNCGVGEDSWESLGLQGDPTSYPKGDQSWVFIGRTDAEAETPIFWPLHAKSWLIGKDSDAGRDWGQEEKETTEDQNFLKDYAFKLWCWRRLLRVPWTARLNQSILKKINPEYSSEGLMLKLKLQYFDHLLWRADSLKKTLMLGKIEGRRRTEWQRMRCLSGITNSMDMSLSKLQDTVKDRKAWHAAVYGVTKIWTLLSDWTTTKLGDFILVSFSGNSLCTFGFENHWFKGKWWNS